MPDLTTLRNNIEKIGFIVINDVFSNKEIDDIVKAIEDVESSNTTFRKSKDLFAIRQFFKEVPAVIPFVFHQKLNHLINELFGAGYFHVKSIFFDKPGSSNWFVSYHQDLTISVKERFNLEGFKQWSVKQDQYAVQPPLDILENCFTIRIHLDDTNENNGALRVIEGSHRKGIYRPEEIDWSKESEFTCNVGKGGIMIMKPLLLHASSRTVNNNRRRIIHIEFCNKELPDPLKWAELIDINHNTN